MEKLNLFMSFSGCHRSYSPLIYLNLRMFYTSPFSSGSGNRHSSMDGNHLQLGDVSLVIPKCALPPHPTTPRPEPGEDLIA